MTAYKTFHALADPTRRRIFDLLRASPMSVGELASRLPVTRPAVSQHLAVLSDAGLVLYTREGTRHVYRPDPAGLASLREYVESMWDDVLRAYADADLDPEPERK